MSNRSGILRVLAAVIGMCVSVPSAVMAQVAEHTQAEQEIIELSRAKWQWMAEQNADTLAVLFHDASRFVHMGGTWGRAAEVEIIRSGSIHYRHADVHDVAVEIVDDTAIIWSRITLQAEVRGQEVSNPFTVTEVFHRQPDGWKLLALSFSSVRPEHVLAPR